LDINFTLIVPMPILPEVANLSPCPCFPKGRFNVCSGTLCSGTFENIFTIALIYYKSLLIFLIILKSEYYIGFFLHFQAPQCRPSQCRYCPKLKLRPQFLCPCFSKIGSISATKRLIEFLSILNSFC